MTEAELQAIQERADKATPGKWYWGGVISHKDVMLATTGNGNNYEAVMDFIRWGMDSAAPRFNTGGCMERIDAMAIPRQAHRPDGQFYQINHPDAEFIAHAREDIPLLLEEVARLNKKVDNCNDALETHQEIQDNLHETISNYIAENVRLKSDLLQREQRLSKALESVATLAEGDSKDRSLLLFDIEKTARQALQSRKEPTA